MSKKKYAICSICKKELPLNRENFKRIKNKITGKEQYSEICRNCEQDLKNEEYSKEWESGKLLCHICGEYKDPIEFSQHTPSTLLLEVLLREVSRNKPVSLCST